MSEAPKPVAVEGPIVERVQVVLLSKPVLAVGIAAALCVLAEVVPSLGSLRVLSSPPATGPAVPSSANPAEVAVLQLEQGEAELKTESRVQDGMAQPEKVTLPQDARGPIAERPKLDSIELDKAPPVALQQPEALGSFFQALSKTQAKQPGAQTRIAHFGDSIVVSDYVSGTLRRKFHDQFGDAGHGYMLIANAWPAYFHNDVYRFASSGWKVSRIVGPTAPDGFYGLGGVSFKAPPGARARFGTNRKGTYGRRASRFTVVYLGHPAGGRFKINLNGEFHSEIDTNSEIKQAGYATVTTQDGEHELEVVTSAGTTRLFGVVMDREEPGVVLDALGVQGARIRFLDQQDDTHWAEQLSWRDPHLMIYQFGANESGDGFAYPMPDYYRTMLAVLEQGKRAVPGASCLVLSAMDRARKEEDVVRSMRIIPLIVTEQERAAEAAGCAFFNIFKAMMDGGGMPVWVRRGLGQADMTHPTGVGSEVLARWVYRALMEEYNAFLREPAAPPGSDPRAP